MVPGEKIVCIKPNDELELYRIYTLSAWVKIIIPHDLNNSKSVISLREDSDILKVIHVILINYNFIHIQKIFLFYFDYH